MVYGIFLMAALAALPGCGDGDSPTRPSDGQLEITASSFQFQPRDIAIYPDESVLLVLHSTDGRHTFTVDELSVDVEIPAGEQVTSELTTAKLGTFTFYCAVEGHREQGMKGTLKVSRRPSPTSSSGTSRSGGY